MTVVDVIRLIRWANSIRVLDPTRAFSLNFKRPDCINIIKRYRAKIVFKMNNQVNTDKDPPSYHDAVETAAFSNNVLKPCTLFAADKYIYSSDAQTPAVYELSQSINFLCDSDRRVLMARLDYSVRNNLSGAPAVSTRKRSLFELAHHAPGQLPSFAYQAEAKSRSALGSLGIERARRGIGRRGVYYRVCRAVFGGGRRLVGAENLFTAVVPSGTRETEVSWEWKNAQGQILAREVTNDEHAKLVITAEMGVMTRDALVAAWMLRLWWDLSEGKYRRTKPQGEYECRESLRLM